MKPIFQAGCGDAPGNAVASRLAVGLLPALVLGAVCVAPVLTPCALAQSLDPLAEARAVRAQRRDEAEQRRNFEDPGAWTRMTTRPSSLFEQNRREADREAPAAAAAKGPSPFNPKFGAPTFQMPSTPAQDATAPQLKQFHPTAEPGAEAKGRNFLGRERKQGEDLCPEDAERKALAAEEGRKSTLSYTGEDPAKAKLRTYDEIYQSKSPYALPTFQMPSGPAAALAAPGAQTWGGRVLTQYRPEMEAKGLEKARMQREQRFEEREVRREGAGRWEMFDRTKRLEGQ